MILKRQLLDYKNLNKAFVSKQDTNPQSINSSTFTMGGKLILKSGGSFISDNENSAYMRIDPQGNEVMIYDGVNNQTLSIYSSSGTERVYLTTINGAPSRGLIDVSASVDHLEIATNSGKNVQIGGWLGIGTLPTAKFHIKDGNAELFFGSEHITLQSTSSLPNHYPYIEFRDNTGARGLYLGWGTPKSLFSVALENGTNLQIDGGNVAIGPGTATKKLEIFGDLRIIRNNPPLDNGAYFSGQIEMQTNDGSAPRIGFHRLGNSAVSLYHDGDGSHPLKVRTIGGMDVSIGLAGRKTAAQLNDPTYLGSGAYTNTGDGILNNDGTLFKAGWYHVFHSRHIDNNGFGGQIAMPFANNPDFEMYFRYASGTTWNTWRKIFTQDGKIDVRNGTLVLPVGPNRWAT
jgi:hypothetical protein